jgi:hypothetical protein
MPSLFNPNDRTAGRELRQVAWQVAPIEWANAQPARPVATALPVSASISIPATTTPAAAHSDGWSAVQD